MLTVDFDRLEVGAAVRVLDLGCGQGRHAFEAVRRGAAVVAVDKEPAHCKDTAGVLAALGGPGPGWAVAADGLSLPFPDASFDRVIAAEVLEHVVDDRRAIAELARVVRPGGRLAVTVPRWFPERVCWALAEDYHAPAVPGGHVRIYRRTQLIARLGAAGLTFVGAHHAHALHSPYWWLKCAVGLADDQAGPVRLYHRFLVWDIERAHPWVRAAERILDPVLGKSLVVYAEKPARC